MKELTHSERYLIARGAWSLGLSISKTTKIFEDLKTNDFNKKITIYQIKHVFKTWDKLKQEKL